MRVSRGWKATALASVLLVVASEQPGRVSSVGVAEVRARVAGIVLRRQFEEGALVKEGQVLFQNDPAPFRAALSRAQAELAKADAEYSDARDVVNRYKPLVEAKAISRQDYDTAVTRLKSAEATARAAPRRWKRPSWTWAMPPCVRPSPAASAAPW